MSKEISKSTSKRIAALKSESKSESTDVSKDISTDKTILDTLKSMQEQLETLRKENKELSSKFTDTEKEAIEQAREEMLTDDDMGPCYVDPIHLEEGYFHRITDTTRPGKMQRMLRIGYEIVYSDKAKIGSDTVNNSSSLTGAVTCNLGGMDKDRLGVLMRLPLEKYNQRQKIKERLNNEATEAALNTASAGAQFGEITIGNKTHFKKE